MKRRKDIIVLIIIALVGYASLEYSAIRMTRAMVKYYILSDNITYSEQNGKYPGAGAEKRQCRAACRAGGHRRPAGGALEQAGPGHAPFVA